MPAYYFASRPPGIGCQPDGFDPDTREIYVPRREVVELNGRAVWGKVDYPEPLTSGQCELYDLIPADPVERAQAYISREDPDTVADYFMQTDELLAYLRDRHHDHLAGCVLTVRLASEVER